MTKLEKAAEGRLKQKILKKLKHSDVVDLLGQLDKGQQNKLASAIEQRHSLQVGRLVLRAVDSYAETLAGEQATEALSDNVLSKKELQDIFED
jgi:hypothetical protein